MSERAFSVFAFVDANAEIEKTLRKYGFHKPEGSEQWRNEQGQTPAQWAHAMAPGETPGYALLTFGCQMNEHDSEIIAAQLELMGYQPSPDEASADVVLLNTCAIRETAEEKVFGTIGWLKQLKDQNPDMIIGLSGCMAQEPATVRRIKRHAPHVDLVFGTHNIHKLPELIVRVREEEAQVIDVWKTGGAVLENLPAKREDGVRAWTTIQYGCDKFCTYCIVPYVRGRERSRLPQDIIAEVTRLGAQGFKEVTLLGQTVSSYGQDFVDQAYTFADLLRDLEQVPGIEWIRFMSPYPTDFDERLVQTMAESRKVCRHVHLPLQSGSDRVLHRMNRRYTAAEFLATVDRLRSAIPDLVLTTDIIVGFPGETEEDFQATLNLVEQVRFDNAFTFWFSPREGTVGAKWEEKQGLPLEEKKARLQRLNALQQTISFEKNQAWIGKTVRVLIEGPSKKNPDLLSARTSGNKIVLFPGPADLAGKFAHVTITDAATYRLDGVLEEVEAEHDVVVATRR